MKVMCEYGHCGPSFVRSGWGKVFSSIGHEFVFWLADRKPAFDAFSEFDPQIFIGTTYNLDKAVFKCIKARPKMKVALYASAWGPAIDKVDTKKYPIVVVNEQEKQTIQRLKAETGQPEFVFIHVTDKYLDRTMGGWRSIGVEPIGVLNAADTFDYFPSYEEPDQTLKCDIAFVGGYWDYKARNLNAYMLPLCAPDAGFHVKIFGNQSWPVHQYLGEIDTAYVRKLFRSAAVCPSVSEPHSTDLGFDLIERPYKVLASGGFCIADFVDEAIEVFGDDLIMAKTPAEFHKLIKFFVNRPMERLPWIIRGQDRVLASHTYFDRVATILTHLGLPEEANRTMTEKGKRLPCSQKPLY